MTQAIILAGGQGLRMRPATDDRPKAMVVVRGQPILAHQLRWLAANGVRSVVVSCGYRADVIRAYLSSRSLDDLALDIRVAVESEPLGRGGGLRKAAGALPDTEDGFLALNGDLLGRFSLLELCEHHRRLGTWATLAVTRFTTTWGVTELDGDLVRDFKQSPLLPHWGSIGVYAMDRRVVAMLPACGDLEDSTFPTLAASGGLGAFRISESVRCLDTVKDVQLADVEVARHR